MKFDDLVKNILLEQSPPPPPEEDDDQNLNFDLDEPSDDLESSMGEEDIQLDSQEIKKTPQDLELAALAINALNYNGKFNPKIIKDYETGEGNTRQILNYIESKVGGIQLEPEDIESMVEEQDLDLEDEQNESPSIDANSSGMDVSVLEDKTISDKLSYYNQYDRRFTDEDEKFWTKIIINALKYKGQDYNMTLSDLNPNSIDEVYNKLKMDFNYDVGGMFDTFVKDRITGSTLKGPGVF